MSFWYRKKIYLQDVLEWLSSSCHIEDDVSQGTFSGVFVCILYKFLTRSTHFHYGNFLFLFMKGQRLYLIFENQRMWWNTVVPIFALNVFIEMNTTLLPISYYVFHQKKKKCIRSPIYYSLILCRCGRLDPLIKAFKWDAKSLPWDLMHCECVCVAMLCVWVYQYFAVICSVNWPLYI